MNKMQIQVSEFNKAINTPRSNTPQLIANELRARLIEEEAKETVDAIRAGDFVEAIDGLCDLLYVVFGAADTFGIDIELFYDEVHRTNMLKLTGAKDEHGKQLKPEGWKPPRIGEILGIEKMRSNKIGYIQNGDGSWSPLKRTEIPATSSPSNVDHPKHYTSHPSGIECVDVAEHMGFNLGNALKYIWRADLKGRAVEDLEKAEWYVKREIERRRQTKGAINSPVKKVESPSAPSAPGNDETTRQLMEAALVAIGRIPSKSTPNNCDHPECPGSQGQCRRD